MALVNPATVAGGQFLLSLLSDIVANNITGPASAAAQPSQYGVAESSASKPYFLGAGQELAYIQYRANEQFKRDFLNRFGFNLPELPSSDQYMLGAEQRLERQAQSFNQRQMQMEQLKKQYEYLNELARGKAAIEQQEVRSLGDIQRERVGSSYNFAQNVLDSAIKNVLAQDRLDNSNVLQSIAGAT